MELGVYIAVALFGLVIGSFLNVVIARLPLEEAADRSLMGRSRCPRCRAPIAWYDNLPVLSWIVLRRRCRNCGEQIPAIYPAVELLTAALWLGVATEASFGTSVAEASGEALLSASLHVAAGLLFMALLVAITFIDLEHRIIPNVLSIPGTVAGLVLSIAAQPGAWLEYLAASVIAFLLFIVTILIKPHGMGMGDAKLGLMMGAFLGSAVAIGLFAGFLFGAVIGLAMIAREGASARKKGIPFGPYLAMGGVLAWFWGDHLLGWYLSTITG